MVWIETPAGQAGHDQDDRIYNIYKDVFWYLCAFASLVNPISLDAFWHFWRGNDKLRMLIQGQYTPARPLTYAQLKGKEGGTYQSGSTITIPSHNSLPHPYRQATFPIPTPADMRRSWYIPPFPSRVLELHVVEAVQYSWLRHWVKKTGIPFSAICKGEDTSLLLEVALHCRDIVEFGHLRKESKSSAGTSTEESKRCDGALTKEVIKEDSSALEASTEVVSKDVKNNIKASIGEVSKDTMLDEIRLWKEYCIYLQGGAKHYKLGYLSFKAWVALKTRLLSPPDAPSPPLPSSTPPLPCCPPRRASSTVLEEREVSPPCLPLACFPLNRNDDHQQGDGEQLQQTELPIKDIISEGQQQQHMKLWGEDLVGHGGNTTRMCD